MVFEVKTRNAQGKVEFITIEADSRSAVFGELDKLGRKAISVTQLNGKAKMRRSYRAAGAGGAMSSRAKGLAALLLTVVIGAGVYLFVMRERPVQIHGAGVGLKEESHGAKEALSVQNPPLVADTKVRKTASEVAREYEDQVKPFVMKAAQTNEIYWVIPPMDPEDPDNALYQHVTQELGSLLSTEPGDPLTPFPYSFFSEDSQVEQGLDDTEIENGNKMFLDSLKEWQIKVKDTDGESRIRLKENLLQAQTELLQALKDGVSVNDSIRAAYEFRKGAFEMRNAIIETLSDFAEDPENQDIVIRQIGEMNEKLSEEGIKKITLGDVFPDYEGDEIGDCDE